MATELATTARARETNDMSSMSEEGGDVRIDELRSLNELPGAAARFYMSAAN
jgi:hypothetical protein